MIWAALAALSLAIWLYLAFSRGFFWLGRERDDRDAPPPASWPSVWAVVPARNEADVIARSIGSLCAQDYPGEFRIVLIDDQSDDSTGALALEAARGLGAEQRFSLISGAALPSGWTGKLWAVSQGVARAEAAETPPDYLLLTDADIGHAPDNLRQLVARAEARGLTLVSLMAKLHCATLAERLLIPAFVFYFQMLFPFGWANDPRRKMAAAAGGCMLVRRKALAAAGGIASIRRAIIDDCALGARLKTQGPIWLGLTQRAFSLRPYRTIAEIGRMVSRSAYAQLNYSLLLLIGCVIGMVLTYLVPPAAALFAGGAAAVAGGAAWALMAVLYQPILRLYRQSPLWGLALPLIGAFYVAFTIASAIQFWRGRGGMWKGRAQAMA